MTSRARLIENYEKRNYSDETLKNFTLERKRRFIEQYERLFEKKTQQNHRFKHFEKLVAHLIISFIVK